MSTFQSRPSSTTPSPGLPSTSAIEPTSQLLAALRPTDTRAPLVERCQWMLDRVLEMKHAQLPDGPPIEVLEEAEKKIRAALHIAPILDRRFQELKIKSEHG